MHRYRTSPSLLPLIFASAFLPYLFLFSSLQLHRSVLCVIKLAKFLLENVGKSHSYALRRLERRVGKNVYYFNVLDTSSRFDALGDFVIWITNAALIKTNSR